ncbi:MAG: UDP-N-acetylmuramate dehydrogenase [Deltaproteobacteria bacterium]|nr:UDP-N-acetylmuramate dehydrogenase [Deltaproteobacteria bacterium]
MSLKLEERVLLGERTSLRIGGEARYWLDAPDASAVIEALGWARAAGVSVEVLGAGTNVVVADRGLDALVLRVRAAGRRVRESSGGTVQVEVGAGVALDELVAWSVAEGLGGLECLSGIPGDVGAAPLQNAGAYGQEVADCIEEVQAVARPSGRLVALPAQDCGFGYRQSIFKGAAAGRYAIVAVRFRLRRDAPAATGYPEIERALRAAGAPATLAAVREAVLGLRRGKSMLLDPQDENGRSAGSFFVNPVVGVAQAAEVEARAAPLLAPGEGMPRFGAGPGRVKLAAGWLIERAGLPRGLARGRVGISTRHALCLVNRGGASAAELVALAAEVRARVRERFGVALAVEPRLLGFAPEEIAGLLD